LNIIAAVAEDSGHVEELIQRFAADRRSGVFGYYIRA